MMEKVKCELCGKEDGKEERMWVVFGHWFCEGCTMKFKDYIQTTVDIAEQERQIKDGERDIVRTSIDYGLGEVIDICYDGFAYKDEIKCKVIGCHKSASGGYILELINL